MTVTIENLGGGGGFPPGQTQLRDFVDVFDRADAGTLGMRWGHAWQYADLPFANDEGARPRPYDAAINPRIENEQLIYFQRREMGDLGNGYSYSWPWQLAWMTQGQFGQYSEVTVEERGEILIETNPAVVFSQSSGSLDLDTYGQLPPFFGQYGAYSFNTNFDLTGGGFALNLFGANPSATPDGLRGHAGLNFLGVGSSISFNASYPVTLRMEARWSGTTWNLTALVNGAIVGEASDDRLLSGMPALGVSAFGAPPNNIDDPDRLAVISRYRAGWLR